jgi:hypothetical protein
MFSTLQFALITLAVIGTAYFILRTRAIDFLTVGWFAAIIYFLPGLVGYTLSPVTPTSPIKLPVQLDPRVYTIMCIVLAAIFIVAICYDFAQSRRPSAAGSWRLQGARAACDIAFWTALAGMVLTWVESGGAAFAADKRIVITAVGRWHVLWEMAGTLGALLAFAYRRKVLLAGCVALIAVDMYIGFRYAFAITFIGLMTMVLSRFGPVRLKDTPRKYWLAALLGGLFIISYQNLKEPLRDGDWQEIGQRLGSVQWYLSGIVTSEPFTTQTILNEIVRRDFTTGSAHLWSASQHLILFAPELGAEAQRFNQLYQPALFPTVDHGLADNIWAQMWSGGGWALLVAFALVHAGMLALGSRCLSVRDPAAFAGVVLFFSYWAFYLHRNELLVQVGFQKQVLLTWAASVAASMLLSAAVLASRTLPDGADGARRMS